MSSTPPASAIAPTNPNSPGSSPPPASSRPTPPPCIAPTGRSKKEPAAKPEQKAIAMIKKIKPFLWFDTQAEDAAKFYCSVFKNSRMLDVQRSPEGGRAPAGSVMVASFELEGIQ